MIVFALLTANLLLSACASVEIPDIYTYVTLPASGNGFGVSSVGKPEKEIPAAQWRTMSRKGVILLSEDWAKLKLTILKNCMANECKQTVGALDGLFQSMDDALKKIP